MVRNYLKAKENVENKKVVKKVKVCEDTGRCFIRGSACGRQRYDNETQREVPVVNVSAMWEKFASESKNKSVK